MKCGQHSPEHLSSKSFDRLRTLPLRPRQCLLYRAAGRVREVVESLPFKMFLQSEGATAGLVPHGFVKNAWGVFSEAVGVGVAEGHFI